VEPTYLVCPICTTPLRQACRSCNSPLEAIWLACPYCATPVPPVASLTGGAPAGQARLRSPQQRISN
jgi:predicted amidophosphoribosyltransferase